MSEAAALWSRSKDFFYTGPRRKVMVLPSFPSEAEIPSQYAALLELKGRRLVVDHATSSKDASFAKNAVPDNNKYRWLWTVAINCTIMIIVLGLVIGYLAPGPITGLILPIGVTLWWLLYKLADRSDQPA